MRALPLLLLLAPLAAGDAVPVPENLYERTFSDAAILDEFTLAKAYDYVQLHSSSCTSVLVASEAGNVTSLRPCGTPVNSEIRWDAGRYHLMAARPDAPTTVRIRGVDDAAIEAARVTRVTLDIPAGSAASYIEDPLGAGWGLYVAKTIDCRGGAASVMIYDGDPPLPFTIPMSGWGTCVNEIKRLDILSSIIELDVDALEVVINAVGPPGFVAHFTIRAVPR